MKQFFNNYKPVEITVLEQNKINGKASERYIASLLTTALNARVTFTSRTEDDAKIDLITLFSHPWEDNTVETLPTQVKSGSSFCSIEKDRLSVKKNKFSEFLNKNNLMLICWAKVENEQAYWFLIKPNSKFIKLEYNSNHLINPLTKFQLTRILYSLTNKNGGKGLIFKRKNNQLKYSYEEYKQLRKDAKNKYSTLKNNVIINPLFGRIEFTRIGWRHITRELRREDFKTASFEVIKLIDKLLSVAPSNHYTLKNDIKSEGEIIYIENEFLLNYSNCKVFDNESKLNYKVKIFIKLIEISGYDKNWKNSPSKNNNLFRRVIFKSIYYKQSS